MKRCAYMTSKRSVDLGDMAEDIIKSVKGGNTEQGEMHYSSNPSREENKEHIVFTYKFLGKTSQSTISIYADDPDFEEYINNKREKGRELLASKLEGLSTVVLNCNGSSAELLVYNSKKSSHKDLTSAPERYKPCGQRKQTAEKHITGIRQMLENKR